MIAIASVRGSNPDLHYNLKLAYRFPVDVPTPTLDIHDEKGQPMVIDGVPVFMEIAPCVPGLCEVDELYPAPPDQRWVQYQSVKPLPSSATRGKHELRMVIEVSFPGPAGARGGTCDALGLTGTLFGAWHSDDRDDRYGFEVTDFYGEMIVEESGIEGSRQFGAFPREPLDR